MVVVGFVFAPVGLRLRRFTVIWARRRLVMNWIVGITMVPIRPVTVDGFRVW
jgi:hypothetical protein